MESEELAAPSPQAPEAKPGEEATMNNFLHTVDNYRILKRGEVVEGVVVRIKPDEVLVDIGAKSEGSIRLQEGTAESPALGLTIGDKILVYVVVPENREGNAVLSLARAQAERDWRSAQQMYEDGTTFDGEIIGFNKGGLIVRFGEVRGFVPASQVVELRAGDREQLEARLSKMIGRTLKLKIIEIDRSRNRLILSEKAAHREWRSEMRDRVLLELKEGEIRQGRVTSLCDFGAFVDLGGIDGLVHISELAWRSIGHPSEVLQVGNEVDVFVLKVDTEKRRVALSIKRTQPEPWLAAVNQFAPGQLVTATITKMVAFGAFARVAEGVEGLIHISELANERIAHPKQVVQVGDTVMVRVLSVEPARRRLSLSLRQARQQDVAVLPEQQTKGTDTDMDTEQHPASEQREEPEPSPTETPIDKSTDESKEKESVAQEPTEQQAEEQAVETVASPAQTKDAPSEKRRGRRRATPSLPASDVVT